MEGQFLPPDSINTLAPAVAEVPEHCGWFEGESLRTINALLLSTFKKTVFQHFA